MNRLLGDTLAFCSEKILFSNTDCSQRIEDYDLKSVAFQILELGLAPRFLGMYFTNNSTFETKTEQELIKQLQILEIFNNS